MGSSSLLAALAVVLGLIGLVIGADRFVHGATNLAQRLGVSPLLVGMLIVGLGTSAPEMLVSATAALDGAGGLALGNAVGSNITNIGLVLGVAAVIAPLDLDRSVVRRELPVLLGITVLVGLLLLDGELDRLDGAALITLLVLFLFRALRLGRRNGDEQPDAATDADAAAAATEADDAAKDPPLGFGAATLWLLLGLGLLVGSSRGVVWGASTIASALGVSDLIIGLTVVAIGTSLPELAASVASAIKGEHALAMGNVLGSNAFNLLAVLPFPALIDPGPIDGALLIRDYSVMTGLTVLLLVFGVGLFRNSRISRVEGGMLALVYVGYVVVLALSATGTISL